ncbi:unnamed protein product [Caenorhabditis bovis]|uniref:Fanconi-associated nuclease n=1 Tax=Caenorhabditis bovis TaxID=2654633 RepID=A0A8S1F105_9PELO|nr:unnamed protein product [Caenorhabditis bovis]
MSKRVKTSAEPVEYNRSIMAAFERQLKGKICQICSTKISLAAYREHFESCKLKENDDDCEVLAAYSKEEAILLRAGPEIVLDDAQEDQALPENNKEQNENTKTENAVESSTISECPPTLETTSSVDPPNTIEPNISENSEDPPVKTKRTRRSLNHDVENTVRKTVKIEESVPQRRRSIRLQVKQEKISADDLVKYIDNNIPSTSTNEPKSPYYVEFLIKIIKRVLSTPRFDEKYYDEKFWGDSDFLKFKKFLMDFSLSAKCLCARLLMRKPVWYKLEKLQEKYNEIEEFTEATKELISAQFIDDESQLRDLDEALELADIQVLKNVAKKFQIDPNKNRQELKRSIKNFASSQKSIFGGIGAIGNSILKSLRKELGMCMRMKESVIRLFKAIMTIYCPISTNSALCIDNFRINVYQDMVFLMLQIANGSIRFPAPNPCTNIASFYRNRDELFEYIEAKDTEKHIMEFIASGPSGLQEAFNLGMKAREKIEKMDKTEKRMILNLPVYERKLTSLWVLTRCCGHTVSILEKQKNYDLAVEWLTFILLNDGLKEICIESRGVWWDRLALDLDAHLKDKDEALKMIQLALADEQVMEKEKLMIQDRAIRIAKENFEQVLIIEEPIKKMISSRTLSKDLGDGRLNRFLMRNEQGEDVECSVEEVVRLRYLSDEGFSHGFHDEGASWHTIFGVLFNDVIFDTKSYKDTWLSELQDCPIDLSNTLYSRRAEAFDKRIEWFRNSENDEIEAEIRRIWNEKSHETNRECAWKLFPDGVESFIQFYNCVSRESLLAILQRLAKNYRNCRSGFPDLTLWNPTTRQVAVVEVKGPGDRLSTKQRLWLSHFRNNGVRAEVCHVTADNEKRL